MEELIPKYLQKDRYAKKDVVYVYEGFEGVKNLYDEAIDVLKVSKKDFIGFTFADVSDSKAKEFFSVYDRKRAKAGIDVRLIAELHQKKELKNSKYVHIKFVKRTVPLGTIIFGDVVAAIILGETPKAFAIHSKDYADRYRSFFEELWNEAKS